ncbi:hypothetical protein [Haloplasma contractile]|uniref:TerB family tellurite resistance protein n=1 Tax=Haloplasma contractile SSD-17B TaxID=1033810 RepID=F7PU69_9MOLU|nr:hypothetical protein [Haloplasma contractile]ERJ11752.1 hypothetical protein HLPCO_002235 [Haloplasma contractile SSD-17B]
MDELIGVLFEGVVEVVGELVVGAVSEVRKSNRKKKEAFLNVVRLDGKQDYITALIGTSVALSYADDGQLDRHEKRMIKELIKRYKYDLSIKTKRNIRYVKRRKMNLVKLLKLYKRLNIDDHKILKIISDLHSLLVYGEKDVSKQKEFLNQLRKHFEERVAA